MVRDEHEGQRVSRRVLIAGVTSLGFGGVLAACTGKESSNVDAAAPTASPSVFDGAGTCTLTESTTPGPYYFDADKVRSDIREDRAGKRLRVAIKLQDGARCAPMPNAIVEIWHCDASGLYSGAEALSTGGGAGSVPQDDTRYLRGAQVTNAEGAVEFTTIWPGWYRGRTVHIHAMVHVDNSRVLTTQVMFDEALNTKVFGEAPYASRTGRDTFNDDDTIFESSMLMKVVEDGDGYLGSMVFSAA